MDTPSYYLHHRLMKKVLGIFRAACYSPGMAERDEAILRAVTERLEAIAQKAIKG